MSEMAMARIDGRHVLAGLIGFFAVMLVANAIFVYCALSTFGGLDTEDAYRKGLAYNATLAEASAQASRGWRADIAFDAGQGALVVMIADKSGQPVTGLGVAGKLMHPATTARDVTLDQFEDRGGGRYAIAVDPAIHGAWIADLVFSSSREMPFHMRQRLWLPPKS